MRRFTINPTEELKCLLSTHQHKELISACFPPKSIWGIGLITPVTISARHQTQMNRGR